MVPLDRAVTVSDRGGGSESSGGSGGSIMRRRIKRRRWHIEAAAADRATAAPGSIFFPVYLLGSLPSSCGRSLQQRRGVTAWGEASPQRSSSHVPRPKAAQITRPSAERRDARRGCSPRRCGTNIRLGRGETTLHAGALNMALMIGSSLLFGCFGNTWQCCF